MPRIHVLQVLVLLISLLNLRTSKVAEQAQAIKGEHFASFMADVNRYIKDMTKGTSPHAVLGGLLALGALEPRIHALWRTIPNWPPFFCQRFVFHCFVTLSVLIPRSSLGAI
jgi:hypothetical protein